MIKQGLYLSIFNFAGRVLNFLLYWIIANKFGVTQHTDWFFFLYSVVYLINTIFIKSVESVFVPVLCENKGNAVSSCFRFTYRVAIGGTFVIAVVCLFVGFVLGPTLFGISLQTTWPLGVAICLLLCCQPSLALLSSFFSSYLQATQRYFLPTIHLTLRTVGIIPFLILPFCHSIFCLAASFLLGELCRIIILGKKTLAEILKKKQYEKSTEIVSYKMILMNVGWVSLALALSQLKPIIDLAMVSKLGAGSVTIVDYAVKLRAAPILILGGFMTMLLGEWSSKHLVKGKKLPFSEILLVSFAGFTIVGVIVFVLFTFVDLWLPMVFFSDKFSDIDLMNLRSLLFAYFPGVPFLAGYFICNKALLVYRKTKIIALIAIVNIVLNVIFNALLINRYGLAGVALSTSCLDGLSFVSAILIFLVERRRFFCSAASIEGDK